MQLPPTPCERDCFAPSAPTGWYRKSEISGSCMCRIGGMSFTTSSMARCKSRGFNDITRLVERMAARTLNDQERRDFAATALQVRYPNAEQHVPVLPDQLLSARRNADFGNSLWLTYNVVQENLVAGEPFERSARTFASTWGCGTTP